MKEEYRCIKGFPYYQVSNMGNVKSFKQGVEKLLDGCVKGNGYRAVTLTKDSKQYTKSIHQLVAESFLNHVPCGHKKVVNHINLNRLDNRSDNLEIITNRENCNKKHIKSSSKYVGVSLKRATGRWQSQIQINGVKKFLGYFDNEKDAYLAYKRELLTIKQ